MQPYLIILFYLGEIFYLFLGKFYKFHL